MTDLEERILIIKRYREEIFNHLDEYNVFYSGKYIKEQFKMMDKKISELEAQKNVFISTNLPVIKSLPSEDELYYEYSFNKHCYKYDKAPIGYLCTTHEDKETALQMMFDKIKERGNVL